MSIANAESNEVAEAGTVVGVVEQYSIVATRRLEDKSDFDREESVANCLVSYEGRAMELRQTDLFA